MVEREVKFEIPADRAAGVEAAMQEAPCRFLAMRAIYYDTPDQALGRHRISLRLRCEGRKWFQTVKAPGPSGMERLEDTVPVKAGPAGAMPVVDLRRHQRDDIALLVRQALGLSASAAFPDLPAAFEVAVDRLTREVRQGDSVVELALDRGVVLAGGRRQELTELELELKDGCFEDVLEVAAQWRAAHGLWLSVIAKADKARTLASGAPFGPPVAARPLQLPRDCSLDTLSRAALMSCLEQALGNASQLAAGSTEDDHVHQLRIALRRLRTVLKELPPPGMPPTDCAAPLVEAFRALGAYRDVTHVLQAVQPQVEAAGGPVLAIAATAGLAPPNLAQVVRDDRFQHALLVLLAVAVRKQAAGGRARKAVRPVLERLWRQVTRQGHRFTALDIDAQHGVRKKLKRLRYLSEFVAPVIGRKRVAAFLAQVKPVQEALGTYNDEGIALDAFRARAVDQPEALFGAGWLQARRPVAALDCRKRLRRLADAQPFWR